MGTTIIHASAPTQSESKVIAICSVCKKPILLEEESLFIMTLGKMHKACVSEGFAQSSMVKNKVRILFIDTAKRSFQLWEKTKEAREMYPELEFNIVHGPIEDCEKRLRQHEVYDFIFLDSPFPLQLDGIVNVIKERDKRLRPKMVIFYGTILPSDKVPLERFKTDLELKEIDVKIVKLYEVNFSKVREISPSQVGKEGKGIELYD